ncbi:MAG: hybrid sensor histidine kinase/response regulator [Halobacteriota archaeon]
MVEDKEKPKILIVEDDLEMGKSLSDVLKAKGYSPLVVLTGKEGVAVAKEEDISLALIDLKLPDIPGIEVLKEIKKNSPRTEAIILTAFASLDTAMEAVNLGAFSYLEKPYDVERLLLDIRRALERKWAEEALRKSFEKLQEQDKMKTDFLNVAYHEMRTPLAPIVANASLLEQGDLTDKQKRSVFIIEKSAEQLEKLINRLLEVTRIDAGKVELRLKEVLIPEIVKNVLAYLKPLADAKKQTISIDVPERIEIEGDEQKITAIFDNLASNAIKYTGENGRIDIKVADRGEDIVVSIADTGIGISEEQLSMVFERFFMADTSLSRKGGLGLGLSIVQEYVKLHGGKVWATSELGKGSNFFFTVPKKQKH